MITAAQLQEAYNVAQAWRDEQQTNPVPVSLDPEFLERMAEALNETPGEPALWYTVEQLTRLINAVKLEEHVLSCEICRDRGKVDLEGKLNDAGCLRWEELTK